MNEYAGFKKFPIVHSTDYCPFTIKQISNSILLVDIKASTDFTMIPGEAIRIDTGFKIVTNDNTMIVICNTPESVLNTKLNVIASNIVRTGEEFVEDTETIKFILHNYELPIMYPVRVPGDKPDSMMDNKIKLISGEQILCFPELGELVAINSYLIRKDDVIAKIFITKIGDE